MARPRSHPSSPNRPEAGTRSTTAESATVDRMFDVGWREDAARTAPIDQDGVASGAGLGLSIARGLARAHGGEVFAERTDEGFRMNVLLPFSTPWGRRVIGWGA